MPDIALNIASNIERQNFWMSVMRNENADMKDRLKASELLGKAQQDFASENISVNNNLLITPETLRAIRETVYGLKES